MTEPRAVISRLSADFAAISQQLGRVSADLIELDRLLTEQPQGPHPVAAPQPYAPQPYAQAAPQPYSPAVHYQPHYAQPPRPAHIPSPGPPQKSRQERSEGWIGKVLAVAGVAVTLIGVVLLLVLAAQA